MERLCAECFFQWLGNEYESDDDSILFKPRTSRTRKLVIISFIMLVFIIVSIVVVETIKPAEPDETTNAPTYQVTTKAPTVSTTTKVPTVRTTTKVPTVRTTTKSPVGPPIDTSRSYYDLAFNIKEDIGSDIDYALPSEYDKIGANPYYISQVSKTSEVLTGENIKNATMDYVFPRSGFPINQVVRNHKPGWTASDFNVMMCSTKFTDRTNMIPNPEWLADTWMRINKNQIKIETMKTVVTENRINSIKDAWLDAYGQCKRQCNGKCKVAFTLTGPKTSQLGGTGTCRASQTTKTVRFHECGHGLGLGHTAAMLKTGRNDEGKLIKKNYTNYNFLKPYGSPISSLGLEESVDFDSANLFRLGWLPSEFSYFKNGGTFTVRTTTNFDVTNKNPQALVFLDSITGNKIFMTYNTQTNGKGKYYLKNTVITGGLFFTITSHTASQQTFIHVCKTRECTIPHGWKITVLEVTPKEITLRTDYEPEKYYQYSPSEIDVKSTKVGKRKTNVIVTIYDATINDMIRHRDAWPRLFERKLIKMISANGKLFDCNDPPTTLALRWKTVKNKKTKEKEKVPEYGDGWLRTHYNKMICQFNLESSQSREIFVLTTSITTHSQTKKIEVSFDQN